MEKYNVYVTTSDRYLPALLPFSWLFNRYWGNDVDVVVCGFSAPGFDMPSNFRFISIGRQSDYPFNRWSDALIWVLNNVWTEEAGILMLEDYWLTRHVDRHAVQILFDYIIQFRYVLKIDLTGDRLYAFGADLEYNTVEYVDLIKSMPGSPYHSSLMTGIWRRDLLLRCLVPNESPHDFEMIGTTRVSHMQDMIVLGSRQWPAKHSLGLRGGDSSKLLLDGLKQSDVDEMRALGYFERWET